MMQSKKGQFILLSAALLLATGIIIYSQETVNTYKNPSSDFHIINSLENEVCKLVTTTNGSNLPNSVESVVEDTAIYCQNRGNINCSLSIINTTQVPFGGNWSMHNYTHYNYSLWYNTSFLEYNNSFTC